MVYPEVFLDLIMWPNEPFSILKSLCISSVDWDENVNILFTTHGLDNGLDC